jgi:DNA-binding HxlR family transcriptional regulator
MASQERNPLYASNLEVTNTDNQADNIRKKINKLFYEASPQPSICPVRNILDRIGDKWSILIILHLGDKGTMRFSEMGKHIEEISQRMLTVTLKSLERDGIVSRKIYAQVPPRVEYTLTALGFELLLPILNLAQWANEKTALILKAREKYDKQARE